MLFMLHLKSALKKISEEQIVNFQEEVFVSPLLIGVDDDGSCSDDISIYASVSDPRSAGHLQGFG